MICESCLFEKLSISFILFHSKVTERLKYRIMWENCEVSDHTKISLNEISFRVLEISLLFICFEYVNLMAVQIGCKPVNPLRPNSDLSQSSHFNIKGLSVSEVMRIENMITQVKFY